MVNATEMAKAFDRDLYQFTKSEDTKRFIEACQKPANAGLLGIVNESDLIISRQKSGTYMHRVLAIKFAAWLNPDFEIWVYSTIERILFGKHAQREESLELERQLKYEKSLRKSLTAAAVTEMRSLFEEDEE